MLRKPDRFRFPWVRLAKSLPTASSPHDGSGLRDFSSGGLVSQNCIAPSFESSWRRIVFAYRPMRSTLLDHLPTVGLVGLVPS